jgi:hypothetical protein
MSPTSCQTAPPRGAECTGVVGSDQQDLSNVDGRSMQRLGFVCIDRDEDILTARRARILPGPSFYTRIRSTSSRLISSCRRSYSWVVRVDAWFAIAAAFSSVPPFFR